ncbi:Gfo/Idh/MocA family protein [Roseibium marinum]|uniref:Oxidoreductase family protein n=1 Tax=Roseibium marinum TaxID=281252 RepID=A0A2S3UK96_9HYPH|nr:Gfo/Idh/MocA family oxidoreductase [Roseibium marinum]POF28003.1 oxidoreductase family protein [Roseibium marinum]
MTLQADTAQEAAAQDGKTRAKGVAIIGAGERGIYYVGTRMAETAEETGFRIVTVFDRIQDRTEQAVQHLDEVYRSAGIDFTVQAAGSLDQAVTHPDVDLVIVTTHTHAHVKPVEAAAKAGKLVYLDKPISVTLEDAEEIARIEKDAARPFMMGFTRRYERPWIAVVDRARTPAIGSPRMILLRSVIPYTRYLQLWHRTNSLSGGAINDKGSHHFDVFNWIARSKPVSVNAIGGRSSIFTPDPNAPERCAECDRECPYRRHETLIDKAEGVGRVPNASWLSARDPQDRNDNCVYLPGSDIDDHAIISVQYENGIKACLFFTIFGPYSEDQETLEIVGENGRLRMERHSGAIDVVSQHGEHREVIDASAEDSGSSHFGADLELVRRMRRYCDGEMPPVGISDGVASLRIVNAAHLSLRNHGRAVNPQTMEFL